MDYKNILIIQTAFIGDAILASSLLEKFHREMPSSTLSILVRQGNESIYKDHPYLKQVMIWNKKEKKTKHLFELLFSIRKQKFDCVINCHRYASSGFLTAFSGARHKAGFKQNPFSFLFNTAIKHVFAKEMHEINRYHSLVADFMNPTVCKPKLYPSAHDASVIKPYLYPNFVCMAPASVWFTKQLPKNRWVELCALQPQNTLIYLLGAPGDHELCEAIKHQSPSAKIINLSGKLSLLQSALLMKSASMNYVNDSAPLHLASAVNAPVTAFFLSTVTQFGFGPLSDQSNIVEVLNLNCRPCGVHGHKACPKGHFKCASEIDLKSTFY